MVADVISCDKLLRHPRGLVWELISSPDMYPMFFTGVGSCETLIESTEAGPDPEYVVLSAKVKARVRLILSNTKESLAIEGRTDLRAFVRGAVSADPRPNHGVAGGIGSARGNQEAECGRQPMVDGWPGQNR